MEERKDEGELNPEVIQNEELVTADNKCLGTRRDKFHNSLKDIKEGKARSFDRLLSEILNALNTIFEEKDTQ